MLTKPLTHLALGDIVGRSVSVSIRAHLDDWRHRAISFTMKHWGLLMVAEEATMAASAAPLDKSPSRWLVTCSCGWEQRSKS